ncbi:MAG: DUF6088 family protein [Chthoniobacterales bacterium]
MFIVTITALAFARSAIPVICCKKCIICNIKQARAPISHPRQILRRIANKGRGWAFTPRDYADLGDPRSVGMALVRLVRDGRIRRVGRGLYDCPRAHPVLGQTGATSDAVVSAVAQNKNLRVLPSKAVAANRLGLNTQVTAQMVYHTDGAPAASISVSSRSSSVA